jgi:hypothetical protein
MGRRWLAVAATALMTAYVALVVVPAAETSPAPIPGTAPSYGPKTVSAVPNAPAIVRRIWLPELDAGYDPQGLAVDDRTIYVSAYRSVSLGVRRGPCRVIRIDLETGGSTGYVDVPSPCGHAGGLAVGGDGMLYVSDTHTLFATPLVRAFDGGARFRQFSLGPGSAIAACRLLSTRIISRRSSPPLRAPGVYPSRCRVFRLRRGYCRLSRPPRRRTPILNLSRPRCGSRVWLSWRKAT